MKTTKTKPKTRKKQKRKYLTPSEAKAQSILAGKLLLEFLSTCRKKGVNPIIMTRELIRFTNNCIEVIGGAMGKL